MTLEIASNIDAGSKKPRRFQFGLRAMFVITAFVTIIFSIYFYKFSFRFNITSQSFLVDAESIKTILSSKSADVVNDKAPSKFSHLVLSDKEFKQFLTANPNASIEDISGVSSGQIRGNQQYHASRTTKGDVTLVEHGTTQISRVLHQRFLLKLSIDVLRSYYL